LLITIKLKAVHDRTGPHGNQISTEILKKAFFHIYIICKIIIIRKGITDDTSFSYSSRDELQIKTVIDHSLKELDEWSKKWFMSFKTEIMLFSNTEIPELNFTFNGRTIPNTNSHKHLGVTFSSDDKWNIHIENILSSIYKHLNVLRKLKYKLSRKIFRETLFSLHQTNF
jgi:hypothetical protein